MVIGLGQEKAILSLPWLRKINPDIDWNKGTLRFREPEAITIQLVCTAEKALYIPKRCPFKAKGRQYRANLKEKISPSKGTYVPKRRPFRAGGRQYGLDLKNLEQEEELSLDDEHWIDAKWDCLEEQCREMVLEARKLEALENEQNTFRSAQTQEKTLALTPEPRTPSTFIEEVLDEESTVHIETMDMEHMDTPLLKEEIPRLDPDLDNDNPEEGP